ncbi:DUF6236 family protein [Micromonospora parva]|uniref:DUF6236 family protein n=1 Tax=Micromonospora parva TaxID=1464048 RepID=UPI00366E7DE0
MGRIVPNEYFLRDSPTIREFKSAEYIRDHAPRGAAQARVSSAFRDLAQRYGSQLSERFGLQLAAGWPDETTAVQSASAHFGDPKLAYIFAPKLGDTLIDELVQLDLAVRGGRTEPYWIGMHPRIAAIYMTALAGEMAAWVGARPVSDDALSHRGVGDVRLDGMAEALLDESGGNAAGLDLEMEPRLVIADVAIKTVVPAGLDKVPVQKILAFRDRYPQLRAAFQDEVSALTASLSSSQIGDRDALEDLLRDEYKKRLQPKVEELRSRLSSHGIDTVVGVFNVKTSPAGIAGGLLLETLHSPRPVVAAGAVAVSLWASYRDQHTKRQAIFGESPAASYLYQIERNLGKKVRRQGRRTTQK